MSISDLFTSGFVVQGYAEARDQGKAKQPGQWITRSTISGRIRLLHQSERKTFEKFTVESTHRFYCTDLTVFLETERQRIVDPDGKIYTVLDFDNPHNMDEFMQVECYRGQLEKEDE